MEGIKEHKKVKQPLMIITELNPLSIQKPVKSLVYAKGNLGKQVAPFHSFSQTQIRQVHENHSNDNLVFRRLCAQPPEPQYLSRHSNRIDPFFQSNILNPVTVKSQTSPKSYIQQFIGLYPAIVSILEKFLGKCSGYETGQPLKLTKAEKKRDLTKNEQENSIEIEIPPLELMTPEQFSGFANLDKKTNCKLQVIIEEADKSMNPVLERLVFGQLDALLENRIGVFLLVKVIEKSPSVLKAVEQWAFKHFSNLVINEFGSKLLQKVALQSPKFRKATLLKSLAQWNALSEHISFVFFIGSLMKIAEDKKEFTEIIFSIRSQFSSNISYRYNKRILVSFTRYCCDSDLEIVFHLLSSMFLFQEVQNDIYLALSFSILLARDNAKAKAWVLEQTPQKISKLLKIKHYRSLCELIMIDMHVSFKHKILCRLKNTLKEMIEPGQQLDDLSPSLIFAFWIVLKYFDLNHLLEDPYFCKLVVLQFEREFPGCRS